MNNTVQFNKIQLYNTKNNTSLFFFPKKTMEANQEVELLTKDRDQIVLELESTRNQLEK